MGAENGYMRDELVERVKSDSTSEGARALLELTYGESDTVWLQNFMVKQCHCNPDFEHRMLALTCLGHSARLSGSIADGLPGRILLLLDRGKDRKRIEFWQRLENCLADVNAYTGGAVSDPSWWALEVRLALHRARNGDPYFWDGVYVAFRRRWRDALARVGWTR